MIVLIISSLNLWPEAVDEKFSLWFQRTKANKGPHLRIKCATTYCTLKKIQTVGTGWAPLICCKSCFYCK